MPVDPWDAVATAAVVLAAPERVAPAAGGERESTADPELDVVREMEDRYRRMSKIGVRNVASYNERAWWDNHRAYDLGYRPIGRAEVLNLFMDFETFGEHQWQETGIFEFLRAQPRAIARSGSDDHSLQEPG